MRNNEDERPSPLLSAFMTLGIVGSWTVGYFATKNLSFEDIFGSERTRAHEILVQLEQYSNSPCPISAHCAINVLPH